MEKEKSAKNISKKSLVNKKVKEQKEKVIITEEVADNSIVVEEVVEKTPNYDNLKVFKILSYIGILWIIGLLVPEKNDKDLKFHVGQGMVLTIFGFVLFTVATIINRVIIANIFRTQLTYWGTQTGVYTTSGFGLFIMGSINIAVSIIIIAFIAIGINNVLNNKKEELPFIGKYAFYK